MSRIRLASWLFAGLTAAALLFSTQLYVLYRAQSSPISFPAVLMFQIGQWYSWLLLGPLAWVLATRWPIRGGQKIRNTGCHVAIGLAVTVIALAAYIAFYSAVIHLPITRDWFTETDRSRSFRANALFIFSAFFHMELLAYGVIVAIAHAVHSSQEARARERETLQLSSQLATAKLQVLTAQLQPHFLFNTLHTIGSLILQHKNDRATEMLAELGELLRMTLERQSAGLITLRGEFEHLKRYLHIEETRFGDRLTIAWHVEPGALDALVPPLILQPVVENALKHGVSACTGPATVDIRASAADGRLRVSVYNDGPLLVSTSSGTSFGFGLRNVRERLVTLDTGATLTLENVGTSGVRATVEMPALVAAEVRGEVIGA